LAALVLAAPIFLAGADATSLNLQVSSETAPAGGWIQIKIFAPSPANIGSASFSMDLDPAAFASITRVAAFSAAGDAEGYASVSGLHIDAQIWSTSGLIDLLPSGSIGANPGVPVFAIWASVFVGAQPGSVTSLTLNSGAAAWDAKGNPYAVTVTPGQLTVNNSISVQDVIPGGGTVGPGATVRITGSGFDATTAVTINGLKLASQNLLNTGEIDVTVDPSSPAMEMTGRHIHLANAAGG
jgi:hypothetical protein